MARGESIPDAPMVEVSPSALALARLPNASESPSSPAIGDPDARSHRTPLADGKLVTQREDLELEGGSRSEAGAERGDEGEEDHLHEGRRLPHLA